MHKSQSIAQDHGGRLSGLQEPDGDGRILCSGGQSHRADQSSEGLCRTTGDEENDNLLTSILGIGYLTVAIIAACILNMEKWFGREGFQAIVSYAGFVPFVRMVKKTQA